MTGMDMDELRRWREKPTDEMLLMLRSGERENPACLSSFSPKMLNLEEYNEDDLEILFDVLDLRLEKVCRLAVAQQRGYEPGPDELAPMLPWERELFSTAGRLLDGVKAGLRDAVSSSVQDRLRRSA